MSSLVKLVNLSDTDYVDMFNGTTFRIKAHDAELVPDAAMKVWMGDPQARNLPRDRARQEELERVQARCGAYGDRQLDWDTLKPPLEAFDMEGNRVYTVMDDPEGTHGTTGSPVFTIEQLSQKLVEQDAEMKRLQAQLEEHSVIESDPLEPASDSLPPADEPNRVLVVGK